jgi:hypothetical protein
MSGVRNTLIKLHWILSAEFGVDPKQFLQSVVAVPRFIRDWSWKPAFAWPPWIDEHYRTVRGTFTKE